jgi:nicotinate-nucleotide pyrophosphorylase (carboxylating)
MGWKQASKDLDDWCEMRQRWDLEKDHGGLSNFPIEIEAESIAEFKEWLERKPAMILLDNMIPDLLREAVRLRDKRQPNVLLEASGGVTLETVRAIAETGVDRISVGALTHSAPALDIALDYEHAG